MSLTHRIYLAAIATSFLPFSFATGFGYVSPVDALLGVLFLFALAKTLKDGCLPSADFSIVVASLAVFALIFIIQYRSRCNRRCEYYCQIFFILGDYSTGG